MLVLTRKKNSAVHIGPNIKIVVIEIRGDKVRLGFEAPDDVQIVRDDCVSRTRKDHAIEEDCQE